MKTIEIKLYKINELSEESKKIAIEREKKHDGWYCHENSFDIDYQDFTCYEDGLEKIQEKIDKMIESFRVDIADVNEKLKKEGYGIIESEETDEETEERLLEENYYFYNDGSFYGVL